MKIWSALLILFCFSSPARAADGISFIVNADNPITQIKVMEIRDYYFKKKRAWPDGTTVRFIDCGSGSAARKIFLSSIIKKTPEDVDLFWIGQKLYSGASSPLQESSERMTIRFVSSFKGAIGYISAETPVTSAKVKIVPVVD